MANIRTSNEDYLAAALAWLRARLEHGGDRADAHAEAAAAMTAAEGADPPPALLLLAGRLGLSRFERDLLLLCVSMELDTRLPALCAHAQGDARLTHPTFALALALFDEPAWDVLSPGGGLRYWRLVEIAQAPGLTLTTSPLRADERIVNYVKGLNHLDDRLAPLLAAPELGDDEIELAASQRAVAEAIVAGWRYAPQTALPVAQLVGMDVASKCMVASHVARTLGRSLYRLSAELLPSPPAELETIARLWHRESILLPVALYLDAQELETSASASSSAPPVGRFLCRTDGLLFLGTREASPHLGRASFTVDVPRPTAAEQRAAWVEALRGEEVESPALLAGQFDLNLPTIRRIGCAAACDARHPSAAPWDACRAATRPRLDALAERLRPKATWDDLVLPAASTQLLERVADEVRLRTRVYEEWGFTRKMSRGLGITVLFAGESGTGKTMAAEVIANELRLDLYRIDLSSVVSKYIGETEKNLRRLFDAAEDGGAILFFDEADALFGKRSEVKDSHDRYANIEINYLLQRMESYRGLAILATNMKSALDTAFLRRVRYIVPFHFPAFPERRSMWERVFPAETPTAGLDVDHLAELPATGSMIHNIALSAAFVAAARRSHVDMQLVLGAAQIEFLKLERPVPQHYFEWQTGRGGLS